MGQRDIRLCYKDTGLRDRRTVDLQVEIYQGLL